ncbi:hypothetical protein [Streptomyces sp. Ru73]|uniref:hypothetical protein n=1 Tax=Streptomyces sp. Ru73 TaxID=2080748 RepID=UPI0015E286A5|nr:hypothetical protein [Streptomyces sp. Ru73]
MSVLTGPELIDTFASGLQVTRITRQADGRIHWQRTPGVNHRTPYPAVPPGFAEQAANASDDRVCFATPFDAGPHHTSWHTTGSTTAARALLSDTVPVRQLLDVCSALGSRLTVLHGRRAAEPPAAGPQPVGPVPPWLDRLNTWLESGRGPRASAGFHYRLRSQLGPSRWDSLRDCSRELLRPQEPAATLHGWLTLGSVVLPDPPGRGRPSTVLSGAEATVGRPEVDLACVIGELEEFRITADRLGTDATVQRSLAAAFLTHYGDGWDRDAVAAGALARIASHAHDFASYVGWHASLHDYVPMLADLLDGAGSTVLSDL